MNENPNPQASAPQPAAAPASAPQPATPTTPVPVVLERKSPGLAGFLSIFPGIGHVYLACTSGPSRSAARSCSESP
jgi:hypothetical protein